MVRYKSRKFIGAVLALIGAQWSLFEGLIQAGDYKAIVLGTLGAYIVGNVGQKVIEKDEALK